MSYLERIEEVSKSAISRVPMEKLSEVLGLWTEAIDSYKKNNLTAVEDILKRIGNIK